MSWKRVCAALIVSLILAGAGLVSAHEIFQGDQCVIDAETVIEGDVLVLCRALRVDGTIEGSLIGVTFTVEINGYVRDDIYMIAGQMDVRGRVGADIIFAGPVLQVHTTSVFEDDWGHLISLSISTRVFDGARIPSSIMSISYQLLLEGGVGRDVSFWGSALNISGSVGRNVDATVGDPENGDSSRLQTLLVPFRFDVQLINPGLVITETGSVGGEVRYSAPAQGTIEGALGADFIFAPIITGPDFTQISFTEEESATWLGVYLVDAVREFLSLSIIGVIALLAAPRVMQVPLVNLRWRPISSLGVGIMTFFMSFVIWVVVLMFIVLLAGIFLLLRMGDLVAVGVMGAGLLNVGAASIFYFIAIYISRIVVCLAIGRILVRLVLGNDGRSLILYLGLIVGAVLLALLVWLPVIGWVFNALALLLGLGAITLSIMAVQFRTRSTQQSIGVTLGGDVDDARQIPPPPMLDEKHKDPGMDNLPAGFHWWKDE